MRDDIEIKGARLHNLKNIDVRIPRGKLVVITGPSGSGKSSLAFDTLYAEGQRRYVESLSTYARQFLEKMPKPEVDNVVGISPAIAIEQKVPSGNPRSTVGTVTEIYDLLRLLFARIGTVFCYNCGNPVKKDQPDDVYNTIDNLPDGSRFYISFPLKIKDGIDLVQLQSYLTSQGFLRVWQSGKILKVGDNKIDLKNGNAFVIVDRIIKDASLNRLRVIDSIETAFQSGEGRLNFITDDGNIKYFDQQFNCSNCGAAMIEPQPRLFSFNNPFGACPGCQGFGDMMDFDLAKIIPDQKKSLRQGAIAVWNTPAYRHMLTKLSYIAPSYGISMEGPFRNLSEEQKALIINGNRDFTGIRGFFKWLETKKYKVHVRVLMSRFRSYFTCTMCHGNRLRTEALAVTINSVNISELSKMNMKALADFFKNLALTRYAEQVADQLLREIRKRLQYLLDIGLDYLHLDRRSNTLSGGEFQRINLATALGSALTGTMYVLDEPTIGLHPADTYRLIKILKSLTDIGNTAVVVEHDRAVIQKADYVIDLGPAAGENGGEVIFQGTFSGMMIRNKGLTAAYLSNKKQLPTPENIRTGSGKVLYIIGAAEHNLKNLNVNIPLGKLVCVTGVSGSGKSTLINEVLYKGYLHYQGKFTGKYGKHREIRGLQFINGMEMVDQSPIGKTPRSNPVTYVKGFDEIRKLFAETSHAKAHGYKPGFFSFNVPGGRCETCEGNGEIKIEMQFLADIYIQCEACDGKRYKPEILKSYYKTKNIHDILHLSVDQAVLFFSDQSKIVRKLKVLQDVGLGYLRLGQPATTLSGGEAQRIKLAAHLNRQTQRAVLFIFDEPTTGLHFDDIAKLLKSFDTLIERGASVLLIEHHPEVIRYADWIIDLGPKGGENGGEIVGQGTPEDVMRFPRSLTGKYLKRLSENES